MFEEHSLVELKLPLPRLQLQAGAVVVHVHPSGEAFEVEFSVPDGHTSASRLSFALICARGHHKQAVAGTTA
jgi:hypothetical protein